ncbi:MAG: hypothetical protein QOI95_4254 [Acidimicrobiaceae bacterium]
MVFVVARFVVLAVAAFAAVVDVVADEACGVVAAVEEGVVAGLTDALATDVLGAFAASHPVMTTIPVAPAAPVMRRARRAGWGRRRFVRMGTIIEPQSQRKLGAA